MDELARIIIILIQYQYRYEFFVIVFVFVQGTARHAGVAATPGGVAGGGTSIRSTMLVI